VDKIVLFLLHYFFTSPEIGFKTKEKQWKRIEGKRKFRQTLIR